MLTYDLMSSSQLERYIAAEVQDILSRKMCFIGGPRQVGKTTFSLGLLKPSRPDNPSYLNWDRTGDRLQILKDQIPMDSKLIVFDEIHKYPKWRNLLKGLYDKYHLDHRFLVTGSARLDLFRRGGDSLLGRYRYIRLHPLSPSEISKSPNANDVQQLLRFGGFPEPFFSESEKQHRLWQRDRLARVVQEDIRDLQNIKDLSAMLLLAETLPSRVGSPLSLKSLEEDLGVSQPTIKKWVEILHNLYYSFAVAPFGAPKLRAVKKLQKVYLWDWSQVEDSGARFENFVASQLLKYCHFIEDTEGFKMDLRYLRDTDGREIDFVVLKEGKPQFAVECKTGERALSKHIDYFRSRTKIPQFYQVHLGQKDFGTTSSGRALPFWKFSKEIGLP